MSIVSRLLIKQINCGHHLSRILATCYYSCYYYSNLIHQSAHQTTQQNKVQGNFYQIRTKYTKKPSATEDLDFDDENADSSEYFKDERDSKVVKCHVNSLRADLIVKSGLGLARNKVEVIFYENKIRVNGKKLPKKSANLNIGDEIDVIKGFSNTNSMHLLVARILILSATPKEDGLVVMLRRYKSMVIENYEGVNQYKSSDSI